MGVVTTVPVVQPIFQGGALHNCPARQFIRRALQIVPCELTIAVAEDACG